MMAALSNDLRASAELVVAATGASVELEAGAGKTELVAAAAAVAAASGRRTLILTHTHAGADTIRRRLRRFDVPSTSQTVTTIDSWARRLGLSFPSLATYDESDEIDWRAVRTAARRGLAAENLKWVFGLGYDLLIVDEYQDCNEDQHKIVLLLASLMPTVVFGDPLQAIYDFDDDLVSWSDVLKAFPPIDVPSEPWRWKTTNPALGSFLGDARSALLGGGSVDLGHSAITFLPNTTANQNTAIWDALRRNGSLIVLRRFPAECETIARRFGGRLGVMEEMEARVLRALAVTVDLGGTDAAAGVLRFARSSLTGLANSKSKLDALEGGAFPGFRSSSALGPAHGRAAGCGD